MGFEETFRSVALTLARFTGFTANAFIFGLVPLFLFVLRPAFSATHGEGWDDGRSRVASRLEDMLQATLVASAIATVVALVLQAALIAQGATEGEVGSGSFSAVASSGFGRWHLLRFPVLAGLAVLLVGRVQHWSLAGAGDGRKRPGSAWWIGWGTLGLVLLATSTMSGHAVVATPLVLSVANDLVHLVSGAVWFTGIIVLSVVLPDGWLDHEDPDRIKLLAPAVIRFSKIAAVAITTLGVTGVLNSFFHVGRVADLVDTGYGVTIVFKVTAYIAVLGLGGVNHFYVRRRLEAAMQEASPTNTTGLFRRTIALELTLGIVVMVLTGVLTGLARTREAGPPGAAVSSSRAPTP